jgi:hypothetical protein
MADLVPSITRDKIMITRDRLFLFLLQVLKLIRIRRILSAQKK